VTPMSDGGHGGKSERWLSAYMHVQDGIDECESLMIQKVNMKTVNLSMMMKGYRRRLNCVQANLLITI